MTRKGQLFQMLKAALQPLESKDKLGKDWIDLAYEALENVSPLGQDVKDFINARPALNLRELARQIDWPKSNLHHALNSGRTFPKDVYDRLCDVLSVYGFNRTR